MTKASEVSWQIRRMALDEVDRIHEIDVSESGDLVYKWVDGRLQAVPERWERPLSYGEGWEPRAAWIKARLAQGGAALGSFDADRLVGFAAVQYRLTDSVALLAALWVSKHHRRQGIARTLVGEAERLAREYGAEEIYVSAMPSRSAQSFYRSVGYQPTPFVHRELYEEEPEDIHMLKAL